MQVVWHGNYAKFFELARSALLDRIGYNYRYRAMLASGYLWPVVDFSVRYVQAITQEHEIVVSARLVEYENRLRIRYVITDAASGRRLTKGETVQVAVDAKTRELCFESPPALLDRVRACL
jgi:acyl-CoA thioester hydrolase